MKEEQLVFTFNINAHKHNAQNFKICCCELRGWSFLGHRSILCSKSGEIRS